MAASPLFCTNCGAANQTEAAFCFACGRSLQAPGAAVFLFDNTSTILTGHLASNQLLKDRYHILRQLGKGGMGAVYEAEDTLFNGRLVAIKEMSQGGLSGQQSAEAATNFKREAHMLVDLQHASLPTIHDYFSDSGHWYLVMSFIEGETLEDHLAKTNGWLPIKQVLKIGIQLCAVLDYLHTRNPPIIFRDLKPGNVMWTKGEEVYLIDFGIARHFKPGQARDTVSFGSAGYAAPEQYGKAQTTPRSDIYSLGVMLHECLTGNDPSCNSPTPFNFPPLYLYGQAQPDGLETLIMQMLEMDPAKRPNSMTVVSRELERIAVRLDKQMARASIIPPSPSPSAVKRGRATTNPSPSAPPQVVQSAPPAVASNLPVPLPPAKKFEPLLIYRGHTGPITALAWTPDSRYIASASDMQAVRVWNVADEHLLYQPARGHMGPVTGVAWSPDGSYGASCGGDGRVQVWEASGGKHVYSYSGYSVVINAIAWSPDGKRIAFAKNNGRIQVQDVMGSKVFEYTGHNFGVSCLAWSHDGRYIVSGDSGGCVRVWYASDGSHYCTYLEHHSYVNSVAWSPDATRIASGDGEGKIRVWTLFDRQFLFRYDKHVQSVTVVAWAPDGKRIASGGKDSTVQVWEASDGKSIVTYRQHTQAVTAVAWALNGTLVASGSEDRMVHIWEVK